MPVMLVVMDHGAVILAVGTRSTWVIICFEIPISYVAIRPSLS